MENLILTRAIPLPVRKRQPPELFCNKGVLRNFRNFTEKYLFQGLFFNKLTVAQMFSCESCEITWNTFSRSSRPEVFCKKGIIRNFARFTGKHLSQSLFFNKVADLRPTTLVKKRLRLRWFSVNFGKFLRKPFFIEHLCWLLLLFLQNPPGGCFWFVRSIITSERCSAKHNSDVMIELKVFWCFQGV